ncbi:hypothetical protein PSTG_20019 [Puccinia striiformis f. sp. tritici PST-78]|uniref:Uncharacterized protein n=1 Tax=Puccinia striiformis f. sp. tritici PST-78 TaxID=1165861 RepID=A0A0L0UHW0_9BASI|nr:hypothetical protein PSTG_20019 [Puccinia striiformis f. sp. tritici PST-78]
MGEANKAFIKLKDDLGLSLLTQKYLSGINTANSLDKVSAADNNELLFQNQNTGKVNDPDQIFTPDSLYKDYGDKDAAFDEQLAAIAKHPDDNYSNEIGKLLPNDAKK